MPSFSTKTRRAIKDQKSAQDRDAKQRSHQQRVAQMQKNRKPFVDLEKTITEIMAKEHVNHAKAQARAFERFEWF